MTHPALTILALLLVALFPRPALSASTLDCEHLPAPTSPRAEENDNRKPAGQLRDGELTLRLVMTTAAWYPDGDEGCGIEVYAFAEEGGTPSIPGPLLRVPVGTTVHIAVRNDLPDTLWMKGLEDRPVERLTGVRLAPGASHDFRFQVSSAGTYYYLGVTSVPIHVRSTE